MLTKPHAGWCKIKIGVMELGTVSYMTDVPRITSSYDVFEANMTSRESGPLKREFLEKVIEKKDLSPYNPDLTRYKEMLELID